jgi:cation transport regulator ChaC
LYIVVNLALTAALGLALKATSKVDPGFWAGVRLAFSTLWSIGDPLARDGESGLFYTISATGVVSGILLPVLLLSSFVFKLFQYNPLEWRPKVSFYDFLGRPTLVVRFYNRSRQPLANLHMTVFMKYLEEGQDPPVRTNTPMKLIDRFGDVHDSITWGYSLPGTPFSLRIPLQINRSAAEIIGSSGMPISVKSGSTDSAPLATADWEDLHILVVVTGTSLITNSSFTSLVQYRARRDVELGRPQEVHPRDDRFPDDWAGWENFSSNGPLYVFGYGSIVSKSSAEATLGEPLPKGGGPAPAVLSGYARAWNVGSSKESHPERSFLLEDNTEYKGVVAVLGLERNPGEYCDGAVVKIRSEHLAPFILRERNYTVTDVTDSVDWEGKPSKCSVYTFVPRIEAIERLKSAETLAINTTYEGLVSNAFFELGTKYGRSFKAWNVEASRGFNKLSLRMVDCPIDD